MSRVDAYARVYAASMQAFMQWWSVQSEQSRGRMSKEKAAADRAESYANDSVRAFRNLIKDFPECKEPVRPTHPAVPETIATDPDVGKY